jgi:signal transduction histidine kinase
MLQGRHILVVDDSPTIRKFLRNLLARTGVTQIDDASSGEETMQQVQAASPRYDLVLLDFMLPDIDGIQLLQQIRQKDEHCTIVMITGTGGIKTATMAVHNGADGYINKQDLTIGNDPADFYFALEQALERRGGLVAQKELESFKADFYSMVTHDLRNPTGSIKLSTEMLLNGDVGPLNEDQTEIVRITYNSSIKLLALINNYLDYAKIDAGYLRIDLDDVELRGLVESAAQLARIQAHAKEQTLTLTLPSEPVQARADAERFKQVLDNLLSNAIKYTPINGSINVQLMADAGNAIFRVTDTGYGLSAEQLPQLFTKYHRVPGQSTRGITGTGLGLLIVKEIVTSHGGTIEVESEGVGKGTTFIVTLPLQPPAGAGA